MQVKIDDLLKIQDELDSRIFKDHDLKRSETREDRLLALYVELGELANETRCFKFWSLNKDVNESAMKEEFSDVLHFVLSLGIDLDYEKEYFEFEYEPMSLNDRFRSFYHSLALFQEDESVEQYEVLLSLLFQLSIDLGMNEKELRDFYLMKNKKNHQRQDQGY